MARLTYREMQKLLEAIFIGTESLELDDLPTQIIGAVTKAVPADIVAVDSFNPSGEPLSEDEAASDAYIHFEHDPNQMSIKESWLHPADSIAPDLYEVFVAHAHQHPLMDIGLQTGLPVPRKISDVVTNSQYHRLGIYNEFFRRIGLDHQMIFGLSISPQKYLSIALNRSKKDFTESDRRLLAALRPHLNKAYCNAAAFARVKNELEQLQAALGGMKRGLVTLTQDGRVLLVTESARTLLEKYFQTRRGQSWQLPPEIRQWLTSGGNHTDGFGDVSPLEVIRGSERLRVRLLADSRQSLLLLEEERAAFSSDELTSLGLTRREAEVLCWVTQGKTNGEIAVLCEMKPRTVEKHMERVFQKLGVETRTAAVVRAMEILRW